jgi:hypothetical protein
MPNNTQPQPAKMAKKKGKKPNKEVITNPSEGVVVYRGPVRLPNQGEQRHTTSVYMTYGPSKITSTSGGLIETVVSNNPSGYNDWSSVAAMWDEYRVLALKMHYSPINKYNSPTNIIKKHIYVLTDRDDGTAIASEALALNFESVKVHMLDESWSHTAKMAGISEATFITTATPVGNMWIKMRSDQVSISQDYGYIWLEALIQFRGRN